MLGARVKQRADYHQDFRNGRGWRTEVGEGGDDLQNYSTMLGRGFCQEWVGQLKLGLIGRGLHTKAKAAAIRAMLSCESGGKCH